MVKQRVLIIEDEADARTAFREALERSGYLASEAADGLTGLAQAESWHPTQSCWTYGCRGSTATRCVGD